MNCTDCHTKIPTGLAVIRSIGFERVSFHRECWAARQLPTQRTAAAAVSR